MSLELPPPRRIEQAEYLAGLAGRLGVERVADGERVIFHHSDFLAMELEVLEARRSANGEVVYLAARFNNGSGIVEPPKEGGFPFSVATNMFSYQGYGKTGYLLNDRGGYDWDDGLKVLVEAGALVSA